MAVNSDSRGYEVRNRAAELRRAKNDRSCWRNVDDKMTSPVVTEVLNKGYSRISVRNAIKSRLMNTDDDFPDAKALIEELGHRYRTTITDLRIRRTKMKSEVVEEVLDMGYSRSVVEKAVKQRMQTAEDDFPDAKSLEEAILRDVRPNITVEIQPEGSRGVCKTCNASKANTIFLACGHFICCDDCAGKLTQCPLCERWIAETITIRLV